MDYPMSILGYLVVGMLGAGTFLFLLLLFDKKVAILENSILGLRKTAIVYIALGGVLSVVVNLANSPNFEANQLTIAFSAGLGWPAIAAGFTAGKRVGEIQEEKDAAGQTAKNMKALGDQRVTEVEDYFKSNLEQYKNFTELAIERAEKQLGELREYYNQKLSSVEGRRTR